MKRAGLSGVLILGIGGLALAEPPAGTPYTPFVAPASGDAQQAIKRFRPPAGWKVDLFAAEPMLANPVCFCFDNQGRCYVAESFRIKAGVLDIRWHMDWLDDMLACRNVADNLALLQRRLPKEKIKEYSVQHERIRRIEDTDGDGKADKATVFADGFKQLDSGIGAGLLARGNKVWYTCIPDFWLLEDSKNTGTADVRKKLHTGYGVHIAFYGHDLHGLRMGPDGKLYYSIGDRGADVRTSSGSATYPDEGVVFRCNPDGTELEVVHRGLRNPQELAFNEFGDLFTGDNNCDAGDQARWVHIVAGGDSGWRIGYQYPTGVGPRGPWMAESLWKPQHAGQPAHIVPPLANIGAGPSGLAYYPGVGLPERYKGHFFLCDFRGNVGTSGVRSFALKPKGASFEVIDHHEAIWSILATDVDFGPDGGLYVCDWVDGWDKSGKGRIYRFSDPESAKSPLVGETRKLLSEGLAGGSESRRSPPEIAKYLAHADMRVRQEAQFALAGQGSAAIPVLAGVVKDSKNLLARLHAIWGLGQIGRTDASAYQTVLPLTSDGDAEVRTQAAKVLGEGRVAEAAARILPLLKDAAPRVRLHAGLALGRLKCKEAVEPAVAMLRENADADPYLRLAGVVALAGSGDMPTLLRFADDPAPAVRLGILLALRRLGSPEVARFLTDADPRVVLEAARAINDEPIEGALPTLAGMLTRSNLPELLAFRALNANFRLGKPENAEAIASYAARADAVENARAEAVIMLGLWAKPPGRDRVVGQWRPLAPRTAEPAVAALRKQVAGIFSGPNAVRQEATKVAAALGIKEVGPVLFDLAGDAKRPAANRVEALRAMESLKDGRLEQAMHRALGDSEPRVRNEGRRLLTQRDLIGGLIQLDAVLGNGMPVEKQGAFAILGDLKGGEADFLLARELDRLLASKQPPEVELDLLEAAGKRTAPAIKERVTQLAARRKKDDALADYRATLAGGDAENGRRIFLQKAEVSCLRCHKVNKEGGEVGPDLTGIAAKQNREYLLEALVAPNRQIAKGFETAVLGLANGTVVQGIVKAEDAKEVRLMTAEGKLLTIPKSQIDERQAGKSAMPEDVIKFLTKSEIRDLVEFLAGLKEK